MKAKATNKASTAVRFLTNLSRMEFPLLPIRPVHIRFKGCWMVFFIFIRILIKQSVSKQWRH